MVSIKIAQASDNAVGEGISYMEMANVFSVMKETKKHTLIMKKPL